MTAAGGFANLPAVGSNSEEVEERILGHLGYAKAVAARSLDPRCFGADREDLIAWGVLGLVQAAQRYRDDTGAPFGAYAARRVRGQVLDALRERDPLTRSARKALREARAIDATLSSPIVEISLDRYLEDSGEPAQPQRCAPVRDRRWPQVARQLRRLPPLERRVLVMSYGRGYTLREIGRRIGLSESGVCRVRSRALRRLRQCCDA